MTDDRLDVLIVGAGLSGIGAAVHLKQRCPGKSFAIVEQRQAIGGTWDLFRYPGVRSDSDMYTLGYGFKPWTDRQSIADGAKIRAYIEEAAREHRVDQRIRFGITITSADWSTPDACWTVRGRDESGAAVELRCGFLMLCSGYYRYDRGYDPSFPGRERFLGRIVHPQHWPSDLDYAGQRIVVIGSGATAVTLVPTLAERAAHVTMLQRSPSYVMTVPRDDRLAERLRRVLPEAVVYRWTRARNRSIASALYRLSRARPKVVRKLLLSQVRAQLGPAFDLTHFTPRYEPWDERLCAVPNGDLFRALKRGAASIVTDHLETFTERGLRLASGRELPADLIVTATGLEMQVLGGLSLRVDGRVIEPATTMGYKGAMFSGVPNLAYSMGYTNASWTLKAELIAAYVCRLLEHMDARGMRQCTAVRDPSVNEMPFVDLQSGYLQRARKMLPVQGDRPPWRLYQSYPRDKELLERGSIEDGVLQLTNPRHASRPVASPVGRRRPNPRGSKAC